MTEKDILIGGGVLRTTEVTRRETEPEKGCMPGAFLEERGGGDYDVCVILGDKFRFDGRTFTKKNLGFFSILTLSYGIAVYGNIESTSIINGCW